MSIKLKGNLIILIAGGTGGHMYPAIAVLEEIKKINSIFFITDKRGFDYLKNNKTLINQNNYEILILDIISIFWQMHMYPKKNKAKI